jgi:hypothetical protein
MEDGAPGRDAYSPGLLGSKFKPMPLDVDGEPAIDGWAGFRQLTELPPAEFKPYVPPAPPTFWQRLRSILAEARWRYPLAWKLLAFRNVDDLWL